MSGALARALGRDAFSRPRRRHFEGGGSAGILTTDQPVSGPEATSPLSGINPADVQADPTGALSAAVSQPKPQSRAALSNQTDPQRIAAQKAARIDAARNILIAGGAAPPVAPVSPLTSLLPGPVQAAQPTQEMPNPNVGFQTFQGQDWSNIPQLAAAGAMLAPMQVDTCTPELIRGN